MAPQEGESLEQMYHRIADFVSTLREQSYDKILLITHAGVIRCLAAYFLEFPLKNLFRFPVKFHEHFIFNLGAERSFDSVIKLK